MSPVLEKWLDYLNMEQIEKAGLFFGFFAHGDEHSPVVMDYDGFSIRQIGQ